MSVTMESTRVPDKEQELHVKSASESHKSHKCPSVTSSKRSVKSERLAEAFQAEMAAMDQEAKLELLRTEYEHKMELKRAEINLKRLTMEKEFKTKLAEVEEESISRSDSHSIHIDVPQEKKSESIKRFLDSEEEARNTPSLTQNKEGNELNNRLNGLEKVAESLAEVARSISLQNVNAQQAVLSTQLPPIDLPVFSGNPLEYPLWKNAFFSLVDSKGVSHLTKLHYLNKSVSGAPKEVVQHYLLLGTEDAYHRACAVLADRYGSQNVVSSAFMRKLSTWPRISDRDALGLRKFGDFLDQVAAAKTSIPTLDILDFPQENVKLLEKLPWYLERQWREEISRWQRRGFGSYPTFVRFAEFVQEAAHKANIPELECLKRMDHSSKITATKGLKPSGKTLATSVVNEDGKQGEYSSCPFCKKNHHLDNCGDFMKKPYFQRRRFFFQKKLCMGCGMADNHQSKDCERRKSCKECNEKHLTCLHHPVNHAEGSSKCTSVCAVPDQDDRDHCMIVPVWVRHVENPKKEFLQYAILDDQSNVGFVSDELLPKLDVSGAETDLRLTTMHSTSTIKSKKVSGLQVLDFNREHVIDLPALFARNTVPASRSQIPKCEVAREWSHLQSVAHKLMPYNKSIEVSLLIGNDCPRAIRPREVVAGGEDDPYAMRTALGWGIVGRVCRTSRGEEEAVCHRIQANDAYSHFVHPNKAKEVLSPQAILNVLERDFNDTDKCKAPFSVNERKFIDTLEQGITKLDDGHYQMPLPLKSENVSPPFNKSLAQKRWNQLNARFKKNPRFLADYLTFMNDVIENYAEKVPADDLQCQERVNFIPHTGVYHPRKPDKIRVVFDCSAVYQGVSLNDHLLQGPNMMNNLLGVLCRFRKEPVAIAVDVKSMFHQFFVSPGDRDLLRFLWWEDGNPSKAVVEYRMKVHLFGAVSSPGVANFGLKRAADDGEAEYGSEAADFIRRDFYVDDGLRSEPTMESAVRLLKNSQAICEAAGLKLHKVMSNKREVLKSFPEEDRAKEIQHLDLDKDPLSIERVLGVVWRVESDTFNFIVELKERPFTRRGALSTVSAFYDPCGFLGPVMLRGKQVLQELCRRKLDWDTQIPADLRVQWEAWLDDVRELEHFHVPRCFKPNNFGSIRQVELHHFSDASQDGYGQCTYIRFVNEDNKAHCAFVLGKSRVTPLRQVTIPRLELTAATVSARVSAFLRDELGYVDCKEYFWTDSKVVLGYVRNEAKRFHVFVANRVQLHRDLTNYEDWFYVDTSSNPADDASRGLSAKQLVQDSRWLCGPEFLWRDGIFKAETMAIGPLEECDPEVKRASTMAIHIDGSDKAIPSHFESSRLGYFSRWHQAKKAVARCLQLKDKLKERKVKRSAAKTHALKPLCVSTLAEAENVILGGVQQEYFAEEVSALQQLGVTQEQKVKKDSNEEV